MKKAKTKSNMEFSVNVKNDLITHFKQERERLRAQWVKEMTGKDYLAGLTQEEIENESKVIYETCLNCLETEQYNGVQEYANRMAERGVLRGMTPEQILGGMLVLRDVFGRNLFEKYRDNIDKLFSALNIYEPTVNKILSIIAVTFLDEGEKIVRKQQEAIRELATPVLQLREGLLILPIIGLLDSARARGLTEQLLNTIRSNRAKVVVVDVTGVLTIDSKVANHIMQTVEASRLMGAKIIISGISPAIAQTMVTIGVDLSKVSTISDLQAGIDEADQLLGYRVTKRNEENQQIQ